MGLWNIIASIFSQENTTPFRVLPFNAQNSYVFITAKNNTQLWHSENSCLMKIEGTVTFFEEKEKYITKIFDNKVYESKENTYTINDLEGILWLQECPSIELHITSKGKLSGEALHKGNIKAKNANLCIRRPLKLLINSDNISAEGFTKYKDHYLPTCTLPTPLQFGNPLEITDEHIRQYNEQVKIVLENDEIRPKSPFIRRIDLEILSKTLHELAITAQTVRLSYDPLRIY